MAVHRHKTTGIQTAAEVFLSGTSLAHIRGNEMKDDSETNEGMMLAL